MMPIERVRSFCDAWSGPNFDAVFGMLSDNIAFHNGPLATISGKNDVVAYLSSIDRLEDCRWDIVHIAATGEYVLTERIDRLVVAGQAITLPIMGIFRVRDGLICEWRDYFDLATYRAQWPATDPREANP